MKKKISLILSLIMLFSSFSIMSFADTVYSVKSLENSYVSSSEDLSILDSKIDKAEEDMRIARASSSGTNKRLNVKDEDDDDYDYKVIESDRRTIYQNPLEKNKALSDLYNEKISAVNNLKLQADKDFYNYKNLVEKEALETQKLEVAKKDLDASKSKLDLGLITDTDYHNAEVAHFNQELSLQNVRYELGKSRRSINNSLNRPLDTEISLMNFAFPTLKYEVEDLDKLVEEVLTDNFTIDSMNAELDITKTNLWITRKYSGTAGKYQTRRDLENSVNKQIFDINDKKAELELKLRSDYSDILSANEDIEISTNKRKIAELNFNIAQSQFDNGLISKIDFDKKKNEFESAKIDYNQALINYYVKVQEFKIYIENSKTTYPEEERFIRIEDFSLIGF
ncbi:MAG: TolC family protein [Firmicutes bacterium]|jgi:outer membrane protein TolC|nr:TolC family protein [Bacillota bacterium]